MSPSQVIRRALSRSMRDDARIAGMILLVEPERIGDEAVGEFLMRIQCIARPTVHGWLQEARVDPWRPGKDLSVDQRRRLARLLTDFWKAGQA